MLDDEERVPLSAERLQRLDEAIVVAGVEADAGFVEDVEDPGEICAELGGEANALGFAARERVGGTVEREVTETDVIEKLQAFLNLRDDVLRDEFAAGVEFEGSEVRQELRWCRGEECGEGESRGARRGVGFGVWGLGFGGSSLGLGVWTEVEFDGAADAVEAGAVAFGAR